MFRASLAHSRCALDAIDRPSVPTRSTSLFARVLVARQRRCETVDGIPIDPRHAVALAFVGHVRRIVVDAAGVVVNAGRLRRLYNGTLRDVLQAIEPRCIWLGCTIRAAISQIDHLHSHAAGGATNAANAAVMCQHHNLFKYRNGYNARRDNTGQWHITRPDGTTLKPPNAA